MSAGTTGSRAAAVGGSLGGLTVGLVLRDVGGCEIEVYERSGVLLLEHLRRYGDHYRAPTILISFLFVAIFAP